MAEIDEGLIKFHDKFYDFGSEINILGNGLLVLEHKKNIHYLKQKLNRVFSNPIRLLQNILLT